jgi:hypothetical protein
MTPREELADLLQRARVEAGYGSQGALAKRLNVSRPVTSPHRLRRSSRHGRVLPGLPWTG